PADRHDLAVSEGWNPGVVKASAEARYSRTDNRFGFTTLDHVAWPTLDLERAYRFIEEVLGGVAWATVGFAPGDQEHDVPKTVFMRIGDMLVQISEPQDGVLRIGEDDPNWWPHWCFSCGADDLERNVKRMRAMGIPVFGPVARIGGDVTGASAYCTTP